MCKDGSGIKQGKCVMRSGGWIMRGIIGVGFNDRIPHLFTVLWLHQVFTYFPILILKE